MDKSKKIKKIKLTGSEIVIQDNAFLDSPKDLTLHEYKLLMFLISKVDSENDGFSMFRVTAREFAKAIGVENSTYIYRDLQAATKKLMERVVKIHHPNLLIQTHLISSVYYWSGEGYVDIKISEDMKPYLLNLKQRFTQYKLSEITTISSVYAIKVYELLKEYELLLQRTFFIDDFKKQLNIDDSQYQRINNLKIKVLEISKREINAKTDLEIDFKFVKSGRKFSAIQFDIKTKKPKNDSSKKMFCINNEKNAEAVRGIMQFGYSSVKATDMLDFVDNTDAKNAIEAVKKQIKKGNVKKPQAMIRTALKERWHDNSVDKKQKVSKTEIEAADDEIEKIEKIETDKADKIETDKIINTEKSVPPKTGFAKILESLFRK